MPDPKTILITAGEASGDRLGAALMAALKQRNPHLTFIGTGGEEMAKQGLAPHFPMSDLAVMGLAEVIPSIPRILQRIRQLTQLAQTSRPDLVITIDSQDFSTRLAKALRSKASIGNGSSPIPHIHYVAPKVWAWRQHRVHKLKSLYTHLLTILPFEEKFFVEAGIPTTYVGHPALTTLTSYIRRPSLVSQRPSLALLPGSRGAELKRHWPVFLQAYRELRRHIPDLTAVLALPNEKALATCKSLADWDARDAITPVFGEARFQQLAQTSAALSKSGTNNLELALIGIPSVVCYRMNALTYAIAKRLVKVPYISLPNLILHNAGQGAVYPELIQHEADVRNLTAAALPLLKDSPTREAQLTTLQSFNKLMQTPKPPAQMAADVVFKYL